MSIHFGNLIGNAANFSSAFKAIEAVKGAKDDASRVANSMEAQLELTMKSLECDCVAKSVEIIGETAKNAVRNAR